MWAVQGTRVDTWQRAVRQPEPGHVVPRLRPAHPPRPAPPLQPGHGPRCHAASATVLSYHVSRVTCRGAVGRVRRPAPPRPGAGAAAGRPGRQGALGAQPDGQGERASRGPLLQQGATIADTNKIKIQTKVGRWHLMIFYPL